MTVECVVEKIEATHHRMGGFGNILLLARRKRQRVNQIAQGQALEGPALRQPQDIAQTERRGHRHRLVAVEGSAGVQAHYLVAKTVYSQRLLDGNPVRVGCLGLRRIGLGTPAAESGRCRTGSSGKSGRCSAAARRDGRTPHRGIGQSTAGRCK